MPKYKVPVLLTSGKIVIKKLTAADDTAFIKTVRDMPDVVQIRGRIEQVDNTTHGYLRFSAQPRNNDF